MEDNIDELVVVETRSTVEENIDEPVMVENTYIG